MNRQRVEPLELASAVQYEPLPSLPEAELPDLVGGESYEWAAIGDLDAFFKRIYRYWHDKGVVCIVTGRVLNLAALGFTIAFSGFLLLAVNWSAIHAECLMPHEKTHSCDLLAVAIHKHPFRDNPRGLVLLVGLYLLLCVLYWAWSALQLAAELRDVLDVKHFINNKLGISDRQVRMMTWSELLHRLVLVQGSTRLCAVRDLDELDIVGRIMRKENYLIGMLNAGVLGLYVKGLGPLGGRRFMLTKTLEWNLYLCILDPMFDERFQIKQDFLLSEQALRQRLLKAAAINLVLAPFLLLFLVIYFFMKHAERFYHSPGSLGSRRWSSLAKWKLRELNELPHYIQHRLDASYEAAVKYVGQFPSPLVTLVAKFVSFVAGSFAALLLGLSFLDENLLEVPMAGRNLVWWLALTGILLTISRTFINDTPVAFDPERAMAELVLHTHYLPRHWRGRAHSAEVQQSVNSMFTLKVLLFAEELASVVLTPFILAFSLPNCAGAILQFVRDTTTRVEGVGDVCSLAVFDFDRHGNRKYGALAHANKRMRSKQGKMEKSFLTFVATYPTWQPPPACRQVLDAIGSVSAAAVGAAGAAAAPSGAFQASYVPGMGAGIGACSPATGAGACAGMGVMAGVQDTMCGAGAGVGLGDSVLWQHQYGSSNGMSAGMAGTLQSPRAVPGVGQQSAAPSGTSSIWVGVAEAPTGLRHPNHLRAQQQQQQQQYHRWVYSPYQQQLASAQGVRQVFADQQQQVGGYQQQLGGYQQQQQQQQGGYQQDQQQQQGDAAGGMGAGLGGLGSSPPKAADLELETAQLLDSFSTSSSTGAPGTGQQQQEDGFADAMFEPLSPTGDEDVQGVQQQQQQQQQSEGGGPAGGGAAIPMQQQQQQHMVYGNHLVQQPHSSHMAWPRQQQQLGRPPWPSRQQHPQQQQQQHQMLLLQLSHYSSSLLPGMSSTRGGAGQGSMLQAYPSTMYPGGPSAAAALAHQLQPSQPSQQPAAAAAAGGRHRFGMQGVPPAGPSGAQHTVMMPVLQQQVAVPVGASLLAGSVFQDKSSLAGSDFLPTNEREDLSSRIAASQSLLQSYYESQDLSVQHRQANVAHARSVLLGQSGSAMAAAASVRLEHL